MTGTTYSRVALAVCIASLATACGQPNPATTDSGDGTDAHFSTDAGPTPLDSPMEEVVDAAIELDAWIAPDAFLESCPTEGMTRTQACGNCGLGSQRCTGGSWVSMGPCVGEGECAVASIEERTTDTCAEEARICDDECTWSPWDEVMPSMGVCARGETRVVADGCSPGLGSVEECDNTCTWHDTGTCIDPCGGIARSEPRLSAEVCIPAGPFMRGEDGVPDRSPMREVMLSAYYIDRFPVTVARYRACVDAGVCTPPTHPQALKSYSASGRDEYPMPGASYAQAVAFCAWDGDRMLPTEAQWEKAARGPSPSTRIYPWGNDPDCARLAVQDCGAVDPRTSELLDEVDAWPLAASVYGVEAMVGSGSEWVRDWYQTNYYSLPESLVDPLGPAAEYMRLGHVKRNFRREDATWAQGHLTHRGNRIATGWSDTFRCSRSAM